MDRISINELVSWTESSPISFKPGYINAFSTDTRTLEKGDFFIPIKGPNFDGHEFISEALKKGASGFVFEKGRDMSDIITKIRNDRFKILILECEDSISFLVNAAKGYMRKYHPVSIGITGSVGKTTTKNFLVNILKKYGKTVYSKRSFNNEIGIPKTIFEVNASTEFFIAEIGMRAKGQVRKLSEVCNIKHGIISKIGPSHLEFFNNIEEIAKSKVEISKIIAKNEGLLILNGDDEYYHILRKYAKCQIIACGDSYSYKYNFSNPNADKSACYSFDFNLFDKKIISLKLSIPGYHNIYNAMLASAISMEMGVKEKHIKESIEEALGEDMRMKIMNLNGKCVINDCYNANPVSLKSAIDTLKTISDSRKARSVAIIGDMFELGSHSNKYHEEIGKYLSEKNVDVVISLGNKSRKIYECFKDNGTTHISHHFVDKSSLIESINDILKDGDIVLIKGSRGNLMEDIIKHI